MMMKPYSYFFSDDDEGEYGNGGRIRLKKKYKSIESDDEIIEQEIDEDYVFPISAICKDNNSQSPENINDMMKLDSQALDSSKDKVNVDDEAKGKADEENLNYPLKSQECLITSKDDLKRKRDVDGEYQKKIRDFDIMIKKEFFRLKKRLKKEFRSLVAVCKDNKSQSPGNKIDKETEAKLDKETENINDMMKLDCVDSQALDSSKDTFNVDDEAKGKGDSLSMPVPYKADEENLSYPLKSQECLITSKDDLKYQKKIRDLHVLIELKVFSLNRRVREKFRSLVAVCKDNKSQSQECLITSKDDLERKRNVDGEYQKKIRDFDIMIDNEFFDLKGRLRKKFQSLVAICKDNRSQSQECLITSKDDLERKRNVDGEHQKKIRDFDIMIDNEFSCLKRRLIKKFGSFVAVCKDNISQSLGNKIDKETEAKLDKETENMNDMMKLDSRALDSSKDTFNVDDEAKGKGDSLNMPVPYKADEENLNYPLKSLECLITSKDDLKWKRWFKKKYRSFVILPEEMKYRSLVILPEEKKLQSKREKEC